MQCVLQPAFQLDEIARLCTSGDPVLCRDFSYSAVRVRLLGLYVPDVSQRFAGEVSRSAPRSSNTRRISLG